MTIFGNISSVDYTAERAGLPLGKINQVSVPLDGDDAIWPCGLVLGKKADGKYQPYAEITTLVGTGDAAETTFSTQVGPIEPGSASLGDGSVTLTDDGCGNLTGTGGSGAINYETGKVTATFDAAPENAAEVNLTNKPDPRAVLDQQTDTSASDSGLVTVFGAVKKSLLKVGVSAQTAPGASVLARLENRHIHAV